MADVPSGTVTFLFTDIEGSTRLWERHPEQMQRAFARQETILRAAIAAQGGYAYKMVGDAFQTASAASLDAQRALAAEPWPTIQPLRVPMALHTGAAEERGDDYVGPLIEEGLVLFREVGSKTGIAYSLEGFARLASAQGEPERALRLFGAAAALREAIEEPLSPANQAGLERWIVPPRQTLGPAGSAAAQMEGQAIA